MFKRFTFAVFLGLIFSLAISTFFPSEIAEKYFYRSLWFGLLWLALAIALSGNLFNSIKGKDFGFSLIYLAILLIICAGFLESFLGQEGFMEIKEGNSADGFWIEDDLFKPLDFSVFLEDFSVEFYPEEKKGMHFVKSYRSLVEIRKDDNLLKKGIIEVNRPLSFKGFSFYQYGYDAKLPNQTVFQVVKGPGIPFAYAGYMFLLAGIILSFIRVFNHVG